MQSILVPDFISLLLRRYHLFARLPTSSLAGLTLKWVTFTIVLGEVDVIFSQHCCNRKRRNVRVHPNLFSYTFHISITISLNVINGSDIKIRGHVEDTGIKRIFVFDKFLTIFSIYSNCWTHPCSRSFDLIILSLKMWPPVIHFLLGWVPNS